MKRILGNLGSSVLLVVMLLTSFAPVAAQATPEEIAAQPLDAEATSTEEFVETPATETIDVTTETITMTPEQTSPEEPAVTATEPSQSPEMETPAVEASGPATTEPSEASGEQPASVPTPVSDSQPIAVTGGSLIITSESNPGDHAWAGVNVYSTGQAEPSHGGLLNANGSLVINDIPFGEYTVVVEAHSFYQATAIEGVSITVDRPTVELVVAYTTHELSNVTIVGDDNGADHAGQYAYLFPVGPGEGIYGRLDANGSAVIPNVPIGDYTLMIAAHGRYADVSQFVTIISPSTALEPKYQSALTGELTVSCAGDGEEHAGAYVSITPRNAGVFVDGVLDSTGSYTFRDVPYGVYDLTIQAHNGWAEFTEIVWIPDTESIEPVYVPGDSLPPSVDLSSKEGAAGSTVTVTGSGFPSGSTVFVRLGSVDGEILAQAPASDKGSFVVQITIPSHLQIGIYDLVISGDKGASVILNFSVNGLAPAKLTTSPPSARAGSQVTVSGSGFQSNEVVIVRWHRDTGVILGTFSATTEGTFVGTVTIPATALISRYWILATGDSSGQRGQFSFAVSEMATVNVATSPSSARAGSAVTVTGSGFSPGETVTIKWHRDYGAVLALTSARSDGTFSVNITIPATATVTRYWIIAEGSRSGQRGQLSFPVSEMAVVKLTTSPTSARAGTIIQLTGSGFQPGESVTIRWHRDTGAVLATLSAKVDGTVTGSITIPATATVTRYWLIAEGERSGQRGQLSFPVSAMAIVEVSTSPASARAGSEVTVIGSGFSPGETVTIKWHRDYGAVLATTSARSDGTIQVNIEIPVNAQQTKYWIIADGSRSGQYGKFSFAVSGTALSQGPGTFAFGPASTTMTLSSHHEARSYRAQQSFPGRN